MTQRPVLVALAGLLVLEAATAFLPRPPAPSPRQPASVPVQPEQEETPLGRKVDDFTLPDYRGETHALGDLAPKKLVVVVFLGSACPLAGAYGPRLVDLYREYEPRGVGFLGIDANVQDTPAELAEYARTHRLPFPLLKDLDNTVADRLGAERTPEVFVLDEQRFLRYRGRIDDQYGVGFRRPAPTARDLATALDDLLAGRPVSRPLTRASGCRIGRVHRLGSSGDVTYTNQVSRILQRRCDGCHSGGGIAPFPLTDYRNAAAWSDTLGEVVRNGRMPPWGADPRYGHFRNDQRLTEDEQGLLLRWIDQGCPEGASTDAQVSAEVPAGWRIPQPDQVVAMADTPFTVPAEGEVDYQYFLVDPGFTEDRYLRAAEVRPGSPAVVHHALVLLLPPDSAGPDSLGALLDYAPGMGPLLLPEGMALRVPAGSRFLFQLHYTPNGAVHEDCTRLGLVFADPRAVTREVHGGAIVNQDIAIPAGAPDYRLTAEYRLSEEVELLSLSPHLHLRGKSFRFEAVYPDGRREILLDVPHYDFNWQLRYELAEPKRLPRGTRLRCTARYDNSCNNPSNPDPTRAVHWGDQTSDEMLIGFFAFTPVR